jgi:hypothetical protein
VKRFGRDEPMWTVIHKCMEATLGVSLYSYFYLKLVKTLFLFILYIFSSTKLENKRAKQALPGEGFCLERFWWWEGEGWKWPK